MMKMKSRPSQIVPQSFAARGGCLFHLWDPQQQQQLLLRHLKSLCSAALRYENLTRAHKHARVCASWPRVTQNKTKLLNASMCSGRTALTRTHTNTAATHVFVPTPHSQPSRPRADWPDRSLVTGGVDRRGAGLAVARGCARFARRFVPGGGGRGRERRCSVSVSRPRCLGARCENKDQSSAQSKHYRISLLPH